MTPRIVLAALMLAGCVPAVNTPATPGSTPSSNAPSATGTASLTVDGQPAQISGDNKLTISYLVPGVKTQIHIFAGELFNLDPNFYQAQLHLTGKVDLNEGFSATDLAGASMTVSTQRSGKREPYSGQAQVTFTSTTGTLAGTAKGTLKGLNGDTKVFSLTFSAPFPAK